MFQLHNTCYVVYLASTCGRWLQNLDDEGPSHRMADADTAFTSRLYTTTRLDRLVRTSRTRSTARVTATLQGIIALRVAD